MNKYWGFCYLGIIDYIDAVAVSVERPVSENNPDWWLEITKEQFYNFYWTKDTELVFKDIKISAMFISLKASAEKNLTGQDLKDYQSFSVNMAEYITNDGYAIPYELTDEDVAGIILAINTLPATVKDTIYNTLTYGKYIETKTGNLNLLSKMYDKLQVIAPFVEGEDLQLTLTTPLPVFDRNFYPTISLATN